MLDVVRDQVNVAHLHRQLQLNQVFELQNPEELQGRSSVHIHDHQDLVHLCFLDRAVKQLDEHSQELVEATSKTESASDLVELGGVDSKEISEEVHLLVDVLHEVVKIRCELQTNNFGILLAAIVSL